MRADDEIALLATLKARFENNMHRHEKIKWPAVEARLRSGAGKLHSLDEMERTGGEPDVVGQDADTGEFMFCDCAVESPKARRSVCYDRAGLESRKEHRPADSAVEMASAMGVSLLTEKQYRHLQTLGSFDTKTSSWLDTPHEVRKRGGALFGDRRYDRVFVYHNGAASYYAVRGFRAMLCV